MDLHSDLRHHKLAEMTWTAVFYLACLVVLLSWLDRKTFRR